MQILSLEEEEKLLGFWEIIKKYNLDNIGIFNDDNKPYQFDNINSVFKYFNNNDIFCIKYHLKRLGNKCNYSIHLEEYYNAYISIVLEDFNLYKNLSDKIDKLLFIEDSSCPKCCINLLKNKLLDKNSSSCFKTTTENIVLPNILIFSFDLEKIGNLNDDYQILDENQDKILNFLENNITVGGKKYRLAAFINMPKFNHYGAGIINSLYNNIYVEEGFNYYNDAKSNNSIIKVEQYKKDNLKDFLLNYTVVTGIYISN